MAISAQSLESLLSEINGGRAAQALPDLERLLVEEPRHAGLLTLRAEALRLTGRLDAAVQAFRYAGESGGGPRNWLIAGVLLTNERNIDEALVCLNRALAETPNDEEVLDALITTVFNSNRHGEGIEFARQQLRVSSNPTLMSRAALLLQANDLYEESVEAFKRILALAPDDPALVGAALVPSRFTCDWEWTELLQRNITAHYERGDFAASHEYPLTNLTWCADESCNLGVTGAYAARMVGTVEPLPARTARVPGQRIRIGYVSCDFRNHATMHLMAGLLESHDRGRFEVFAYDYSNQDQSEYRQRFLNAVEHHVPIHSLTDRQAAERIADDQVEVLFDLKLYTGGGRAGILAHRPAPVQAAYLGFPGSAASADVDYIVSDRFVTPDASAPYYTEKFCRLPHSYQCNDRLRFAAREPAARARYQLPDDKVIFGAFNQSYKIDRGSFKVWLTILKEVPDSVLWLLGQSPGAVTNLTRRAEAEGIAPQRLIFAPFANPTDHLARLQVADAVLDALVCNGHTTTSDALWAGVPVVTARGRHFASRVSESLLNAMELPELVGRDQEDMVRIAARIGNDAAYRSALRAKVAAKRLSAPLFDTVRFTRDFETAIEMMVRREREGLPAAIIDVPDLGPPAAGAAPAGFVGRVAALQTAYPGCPLCDGASATLGFASATGHPLWHEPLPTSIEWLRCQACEHVHTRHHWSEAGLLEVARKVAGGAAADASGASEARRAGWAATVERTVRLLGGFGRILVKSERPIWVDVGCGDGSLVMTAADHGFAAIGLDKNPELVARTQQLGFNAMQREFLGLKFEITADVLSMTDVLAQLPKPREALRKAAQVLRPGGVLIIRTADYSSSGWKIMEAAKTNPNWMEIERFHIFSRTGLVALLDRAGFDVADFAVVSAGAAQMELYAVRRTTTPLQALAAADAICMERRGGMGDVLMALGAAKALKALSGRPVILATAPAFASLAQACPYIDHVIEQPAELIERYPATKHIDLNPVAFGIASSHQIDAYLEAFGVSADAQLKDIELDSDPVADEQVEQLVAMWPPRTPGSARILLHAAQGDANRSWPPERWDELATRLIAAGHQVIFIGTTQDPHKPASSSPVPGALTAVDVLRPLATVALMRRSDLFVSTDSGPVQLAAATDIGIVGLYSSVGGACRLPFRHGTAGWHARAVGPSCGFHPCYQQMHDRELMAPFMAKLQRQTMTVNELFAGWCPDGGSFACMKHQITVQLVMAAIEQLSVESGQIRPKN